MAPQRKKDIAVTVLPRSSSSSESVAPSLKSPRTPRFAEATSVNSPIEPSQSSIGGFAAMDGERGVLQSDNGVQRGPQAAATGPYVPQAAAASQYAPQAAPTNHYLPQPQPSDVGFGYLADSNPTRRSTLYADGVEMPATPRSPLRSAMKSNGVPPRTIDNPLSPTFKEEQILEKQEKSTEKEQVRDLNIKTRVRMAKMVLRGTNFSCSLIVLAMLSSTLTIFNATKSLPPRNNLPPWASGTQRWPQITLLCIACVSLFMAILVFYGYWRGGHKRAEKAAVYYSIFAVAFFMFSTVMWAVGAAALHLSKANGHGQDIWGWSCNTNTRATLFQDEVHYALVCRLQNWSLVCALIEIVIETITILIYGIVFYRYYSKRRLRRSMANRDRARSDLYLAQLRTQSAPNTPGFAPMSAREGGYNPAFSPRWAPFKETDVDGDADDYSGAEEGDARAVRYIEAPVQVVQQQKRPFTLQPPPTRTTPRTPQRGFVPPELKRTGPVPPSPSYSIAREAAPVHQPAAPGEKQYGAVPIPGAYASPLSSPGFAPAGAGYFAPMR